MEKNKGGENSLVYLPGNGADATPQKVLSTSGEKEEETCWNLPEHNMFPLRDHYATLLYKMYRLFVNITFVYPERIELPTSWFEAKRSIH